MLTASEFEKKIYEMQSDEELAKIKRYFKSSEGQYSHHDTFIGVKMGDIFTLAKDFMNMPLEEVALLLNNDIHEMRVGAVSIMDFKARSRKTPEVDRKALFELYINKHDRINNWDLVDRSAMYVVGGYLFDKSRDILYKLAQSENIWERRTAIVSTGYFIKQGEIEDTFKIAEILINDKEDLIHKAAGGWLRHAGGTKHQKQLLQFLDTHAATMPRTMLRYSIEKLDSNQKKHYMSLKNKSL